MFTNKTSIKHNSYRPRICWLWALIILFTFLLFRLPGLGAPLVSDELAMVSLWSQMPYLKILTNYQYPNNHIFLSLILSFFLKTFGLKEWLLRMPLLISGIVSIYLSYNLFRRVSSNSSAAIFTVFVITICEKHIYYSTNARGYLVIMVLALIVVNCLLDRIEGLTFKIQNLSDGLNRVLVFLGWLGIWLVGTWTVPTFLFFEVAVAICLLGLLVVKKILPSIQRKYFLMPLASCLAGGVGFYLQYYILIDSTMLAEATSHAAQISFSLFLPKLLSELIKPFDLAGPLFLLFALIGLKWLFQKNFCAAFIIGCILLIPLFIGIVGFFVGKLPGIPHPRTFFYLQPFFLTLSIIGARQFGLWFFFLIKRNYDFNYRMILIIPWVLAGILLFISLSNFYNHTYTERLSIEPLDKVHSFIKTLQSNDLILVSNKIHVELYLYGAKDIRERLENILNSRKLENIYYLNYDVGDTSSIQNTSNTGVQYLSFKRIIGDIQKPIFPDRAFELERAFGSFKFYRLKKGWLKQFISWEKAGLHADSLKQGAYRWEKMKNSIGVRSLIRVKDSFTLAMENKERPFFDDSGFTLNLVDVEGNTQRFSAALLEGYIKKNKVAYNPTWAINQWILEHPFGNKNIFGINWNPAIYISQGSGNISILDVKLNRSMDPGALRNFLSFRLQEPRLEDK
jgi:hypothetical protein